MATSQQITAQQLLDAATLIEAAGGLTKENLPKLSPILTQLEETYGRDRAPKLLELSQKASAAATSELRIELENQLAQQVNNIAKLAPDAQRVLEEQYTPFETVGLNVNKALIPYTAPFANTPAAKRLEEQANQAAIANPKSAIVGSTLGGMLPEAALEYAYSQLPVGKVLTKLFGIKGKSIEAKDRAALLRNQERVVTGALSGATTAGIEGEEDPLLNAATAAFGVKVGQKFAGYKTAKSQQPESIQKIIAKKEEDGYWASPGFYSGNRTNMQLDHAILKNPETAALVDRRIKHNEALFNREVLDTFGFDEDVAYLDLDSINHRLGQINSRLDEVYKTTKPVLLQGDQVLTKRTLPNGKVLERVSGYAKKHFKAYADSTGKNAPPEATEFLKRYQRFTTAAAQTGDTRHIRALLGDLGNAAARQFNNPSGDRDLGKLYLRIRSDLENTLGRRLGGEATKAWKTLRNQQGFMLDMIETNPTLIEGAQVNPKHVLKVVRGKGSSQIRYANKYRDLYDSARFMDLQEKSFENSLAMNQRFGHWVNPGHEKRTVAGDISSLTEPALGTLPSLKMLGLKLPVEMYLRSKGAGVIDPLASDIGGRIGNVMSQSFGGPSVEFVKGLLEDL
jgi:hypothetical protein